MALVVRPEHSFAGWIFLVAIDRYEQDSRHFSDLLGCRDAWFGSNEYWLHCGRKSDRLYIRCDRDDGGFLFILCVDEDTILLLI